jgi:hypothetical protein
LSRKENGFCSAIALDIKNTLLLPVKNTYAASNQPTNTHGNSYYLYFGNFSDIATETFLSFKLSSTYRNLTSAILTIQQVGFDSGNESHGWGIEANCSLVSDSWEENTLTWENKPTPFQEIDTFYINPYIWVYGNPPIFHTVDVLSFIQFGNNTEFIVSICLSIIVEESTDLGYMAIPSKELHNNDIFFGPTLNITYVEQESSNKNNILLIIITIGVVVAAGVGGTILYSYFHKKKGRQGDVHQEITSTQMNICSICKSPNPIVAKFCVNCGEELTP